MLTLINHGRPDIKKNGALEFIATMELKTNDNGLARRRQASGQHQPISCQRLQPQEQSGNGMIALVQKGSAIQSHLQIDFNIAHIIKHVMSSATEAELAALYIMAREAKSAPTADAKE